MNSSSRPARRRTGAISAVVAASSGSRASRMALAALLLALAPAGVRAGCDFAAGETQGTYTVRVPTTIVNDPSIAVNSVLYTSAATGINHRVDFNCNGNNNRWGLINDAGPTPATGEITFPTGVAGIGYRVLQNGSYIRPYDYFDLSGSSAWYENDAVTLELVKTGAITDGSQLLGSRLASFKAGKPNNFIVDAVINLANTLTFTAPACQVNTTSIDVVLPTVTTGAFSGPDSVSGSTPFQIGLTCSSGATVRITLDTASPVPGKTGVIAPSAGGASGIGVQLVNATDSTPVTFGAPRVLGATPNGNLSVGYVARYLQTGSNVGAGNVSATATFTLSYQ